MCCFNIHKLLEYLENREKYLFKADVTFYYIFKFFQGLINFLF